MKIIICGAGQVGESIASHLSEEENDVTIIDQNQERLRKVLDHSDVSGVEGLASYPEVLKQAGIDEADMIIAVTQSDEELLDMMPILLHRLHLNDRELFLDVLDFGL